MDYNISPWLLQSEAPQGVGQEDGPAEDVGLVRGDHPDDLDALENRDWSAGPAGAWRVEG